MSDVVADAQRRIFADNLARLMREKGVTQDDIVRKLGYSSSTVSDWYNAKKYPRVKKMQELADMFRVSVSDLRDEPTSASIIPPGFEHISADFALRCKGDSMINARIFDGDIVYIHRQPTVDNGKIAAVRIGDEATLKRIYYFPEDPRLVLRPCNPLYSDMVYCGPELDEVEIIGEAVAFTSLVRHE